MSTPKTVTPASSRGFLLRPQNKPAPAANHFCREIVPDPLERRCTLKLLTWLLKETSVQEAASLAATVRSGEAMAGDAE